MEKTHIYLKHVPRLTFPLQGKVVVQSERPCTSKPGAGNNNLHHNHNSTIIMIKKKKRHEENMSKNMMIDCDNKWFW